MSDDESGNQQIRHTIAGLVEEEHELRSHSAIDDEGRARLAHLEAQLDQCWDLLRQRDARREYGENPEAARVRPVNEVEGYLQ